MLDKRQLSYLTIDNIIISIGLTRIIWLYIIVTYLNERAWNVVTPCAWLCYKIVTISNTHGNLMSLVSKTFFICQCYHINLIGESIDMKLFLE